MDVAAVELTELEKLEVTRVDAVSRPANGFPVLLMKGVAVPVVAKGQRDCPKCDKSYDADHTGSTCENCGTDLPDAPASKAADDMTDCPTCKGDGKIMGGKRDCPDCDNGKVTPAKAKTLAAKALSDWRAEAVALVKKAMVRGKVDESADIDGGQQAIALVGKLIGYEAQELAAGNLGEVADIGLLADAAGLLRQWVSGESAVQDGNVMPATALMQSAAEDAGDTSEDTSKSQIAPEETTVDTVTQTGDLEEVVKAAVAEAAAPLKELIKGLSDELAKVKATPVPSGLVLSRNVQVKQPGAVVNEDYAAKAAYYRDMAETVTDRVTADGYRKLAREADAKAVTPSS